MKRCFLILIALLLILCSACSSGLPANQPALPSEGNLSVTYIDVGQGDSSLIITPNGKSILIDSGEYTAEEAVKQVLNDNNIEKIDVLIGTHPHSDHIGAMSYIVQDYDIGKIYLPRASSNTKTYEQLLESIKNKGLKVTAAKAGTEIPLEDNISAVFVAPNSSEYSDLNNYSAVLKLTYGDTSFLFTGDAEELSESEMLEHYGGQLQCDVLKAGHHGSRTSSSEEFLQAVHPNYVVISLGAGNDYGHPHVEALKRFADIGAQILRTDELGSIQIISDGVNLSVNGADFTSANSASPSSETQPSATTSSSDGTISDTSVVYKTKSGKSYHLKDCSHLSKSKQLTEITVAEAEELGLTPCKTCINH